MRDETFDPAVSFGHAEDFPWFCPRLVRDRLPDPGRMAAEGRRCVRVRQTVQAFFAAAVPLRFPLLAEFGRFWLHAAKFRQEIGPNR